MSDFNDIYTGIAALLAAHGYDVHRDDYPFGAMPKNLYVVISPVGGSIFRMFQTAGVFPVIERYRIQIDVWVRGPATAATAYTEYETITGLLEYAITLPGLAGFISCRRDALPIERDARPFCRVVGTWLVEINRSFTPTTTTTTTSSTTTPPP